MARRHILMIAIGASTLVWSSLSMAQGYRPDEFLSLDLSRAVLSPNPLGPTQSFTPGPLDVTVDRRNHSVHAIAESPAKAETTSHFVGKPSRKAALRAAGSDADSTRARVQRSLPHAPRALVALHRHNPVEAQARDMSIQVWPCKSGGICNWKR